ncbi:flavin-binding monooxygenase [Xylogone sp. PMI_703]|nr:flavin-binding monooxygenase [Xylogone sp. PMI_703]
MTSAETLSKMNAVQPKFVANPDAWIRAADDYDVPMHSLNDPMERKVRAISIGAGFAGIMMAYKIDTMCENVEHVVYDRNPELGGTWYENRYPGCACDTPAHGYTFPWAPNPNWPRFLSYSKDILQYMNWVADTCDLKKYIQCNRQVAGCYWDDESGKWKVHVQIVEPKKDWGSIEPLKVIGDFWDECDILFHATGLLNRWDYPDIPGLKDFKGRLVHTAGWPDNYGENEWKGDNVVVIGSGASSIQTVPTMQPHVNHMEVFVRTPVWFIQIIDNFGNNYEYSDDEKEGYQRNPVALVNHIKEIENAYNGRYNHNINGSPEQTNMMKATEARMRELIKDDRLFQGFKPAFPVNCRRQTPGDPYMNAIQQHNVNVRFTGVQRITPDGVVGDDGVEVKCNTIVCATGFDVSHRPRFPVVGKNGVDLREKWKYYAEAYFGLACPDMPNWITFQGPNWPVAAGSIMGAYDANGNYAIQCIKKLQNEMVKSFVPRQDVTDQLNEHTQTWARKVVWGLDCRSWYKDPKTGRLRAIYAGSSLHYSEMIKSPRWEDMEIEHLNKRNMFAFMGIGRHYAQSPEGKAKGIDVSPYTNIRNVDMRLFPDWQKGSP